MKKQHLSIAKYNKPAIEKQSLLHSHHMRRALLGATFLSVLMVSACSSETYSDNGLLVTDNSAAHLDRSTQNSKDIQENLKNSYARLASKRSDVCPKLIQEDQSNHVVERISEVMVNDYCDYFIYPREGQHLSVEVNSDQIESLLIVPAIHDFANGSYKVTSYDKHIIRLSYDGVPHKPEHLTYNVAMKISDKQYS